MLKVAIATLGCKVNHYESAGIIEEFVRRGNEIVDFNSPADLYIINTCTVTGKTDFQSRQLVRRAHRLNPGARIIVTGCYAQVAPQDFMGLEGVVLVAGSSMKETVPRLMESPAERSDPCKVAVSDISSESLYSSLPVSSIPGQTRGYVKIQDGCDCFCSYCIIPYARGKSRSRPPDKVIEEVKSFVGNGCREVVITGIHLGHYGRDLTPRTDLAELISRIEDDTLVERVRLSSLEPMDITDEIISTIKNSSRLCPHFHIPLQSGDDLILSLMSREYTGAHFRSIVLKIIDAIPDASIGTDIMTGFPGETEDQFHTTYDFVSNLPFSYFHVFPYSRRPGTKASEMQGQVDEKIKKERARLLRELGEKKKEDYIARFVGRTLQVLIEEKPDPATGLLKGFSDTYIPVLVANGNVSQINHIVAVKTEYKNGSFLTGKV